MSESIVLENVLDQLKNIIKMIQKYRSIRKVLRVGNETVEVLMDDFEDNLPKLMKFLFENEIKVFSMSRDIANFRRYFQIRIQEEEEKETRKHHKEIISEGGS